MKSNLSGFGMRYVTNKEKNTKLGEGLIKMTGKGEPWHTIEERHVSKVDCRSTHITGDVIEQHKSKIRIELFQRST